MKKKGVSQRDFFIGARGKKKARVREQKRGRPILGSCSLWVRHFMGYQGNVVVRERPVALRRTRTCEREEEMGTESVSKKKLKNFAK